MKRIAILIVVAFLLLGIGYIPVRAETSLQRVRNYFTGRKRVTMAGVIAISGENKIFSKMKRENCLDYVEDRPKIFPIKRDIPSRLQGILKSMILR